MRRTCFFSILLFLFLLNFPCVISDSLWFTCNNASTYTEGSTYSSNLGRVITDLVRNTPQSSGFNTTSFGQSSNKVYGLLQCFGNISAEKCSNCSREANKTLHEYNCRNDIGGRVWMDECFLRYDNSNFISTLDTHVNVLSDWRDVTENTDTFKSTTSSLLSNLSDQAYIPANKLGAAGKANYSTSEQVYGLVQCWRDLSIHDCRKCLFTAREAVKSSTARASQALLGSCIVRFGINPFFNSGESSPSPEASPPPKTSSETKSIKGRRFSPEFGLLMEKQHFIFSLVELAEATDNFHHNKKLGEGGFGAVYKGTTRDRKEIAVKKLSARTTQGKKEFMNEVRLMANVQHRNLVKLLGCCAEGDERLLVYEYLPNRSLDTFLFDPEKRRELDWQTRYNIIIGIARGLLYLHQDSHMRIIHRDIKANNILLDDKLNPKIADFGLARLFPDDMTEIQSRAAGTYGYMAPEYAMRGQLSVKADVYSFGVLLLEIISARKNTDSHFPHEMQNLLEWAWRLFNVDDVLNMVDSTIRETCQEEQALRCIHIGLVCVQADAAVRPAMSNVIMMISN
ncbi:hypothetical protein KI387_013880, partial [Taxus chinensis]